MEFQSIKSHFPECTGYKIAGSVLVLQCPQPPSSTPLTVGGLPTVFVPDMREYDALGGLPGNPRIAVASASSNNPDNYFPTFAQLEADFVHLREIYPNIAKICFKTTHYVVTLLSTYFDAESYPGKLGKHSVVYTWPGRLKPHSRPRLMTPSFKLVVDGDITDYRAFGLTPGVKVVGLSKATSSGVLVENGGERAITLADHGFQDSDDVYHPDRLPQWLLGTIALRFPFIDTALCKLSASLNYSNKTYFTANPPKRMVSTDFVDQHIRFGTWFECEGFTVGRAHMMYEGPAVGYPGLPPYVENSYLLKSFEFAYFGPEVGLPADGLCGAPVVHEKSDDPMMDGIVLGFIWLVADRDSVVASVDDLLEAGWQIADQ